MHVQDKMLSRNLKFGSILLPNGVLRMAIAQIGMNGKNVGQEECPALVDHDVNAGQQWRRTTGGIGNRRGGVCPPILAGCWNVNRKNKRGKIAQARQVAQSVTGIGTRGPGIIAQTVIAMDGGAKGACMAGGARGAPTVIDMTGGTKGAHMVIKMTKYGNIPGLFNVT